MTRFKFDLVDSTKMIIFSLAVTSVGIAVAMFITCPQITLAGDWNSDHTRWVDNRVRVMLGVSVTDIRGALVFQLLFTNLVISFVLCTLFSQCTLRNTCSSGAVTHPFIVVIPRQFACYEHTNIGWFQCLVGFAVQFWLLMWTVEEHVLSGVWSGRHDALLALLRWLQLWRHHKWRKQLALRALQDIFPEFSWMFCTMYLLLSKLLHFY